MGMIFRMILSIFGEIFDQDARRRQEEQARAAALRQKMAERQAEKEGGGQVPPKPKGFLQQVLAELEQLEAESSAPPAPRPVPAARPARVANPPRPKTESMEEHLNKLEQRGERLGHMTEAHLGIDLETRQKQRKKLELPGETVLAKMIYAQVILGPCKARRGKESFLRQ